jgi:hypothetical protein
MGDTEKITGVWQQMIDAWPSRLVARTEVDRFSGGLLTSKYMANLDSLGLGCERVTCGRKIAYPIDSLVAWMRGRSGNRKEANHAG